MLSKYKRHADSSNLGTLYKEYSILSYIYLSMRETR